MISRKTAHSLPKSKRLRTPAEYKEIYGGEYWGNTRYFSFNVTPADSAALGVTVSKKVSNLAVKRNLIKRQIKEFYRLHQSQLPKVKIIITAKSPSGLLSGNECKEELGELWQKVLKWNRWYKRKGHIKDAQADNDS